MRIGGKLGLFRIMMPLCMLATISVGCSEKVELTPPRSESDLVGSWKDNTGETLPNGTRQSDGVLVIASRAISTTCTSRNITILIQLSVPIGTRLNWDDGYDEQTQAPRYIRENLSSGLDIQGAPSDLDVDLPLTATPTGFNREGNEVNYDSANQSLYVKRSSNQVERWARLDPNSGCA